MTDWQHRVVQERAEIQARLENLLKFTNTQVFEAMHPLDQGLMNQQAAFMAQYVHALTCRIARFQVE